MTAHLFVYDNGKEKKPTILVGMNLCSKYWKHVISSACKLIDN